MSAPDRAGDASAGGGIPVPPEVPDEFAAAYREAYARALAAQSPHKHRALWEDPDDAEALPERTQEPDSGTHRVPEDSVWAQMRASRWFVPVLLMVLAVLLVLVAYLLGVALAAHLNASATPAGASGDSLSPRAVLQARPAQRWGRA